VAPDDEAALAAAMAEAVNDPDERRRRGERARHTAVDRFSWTGIAAQLASVLAEVVGAVRRAGDVTLRGRVRSRGER
jgi:glycosyltransferase involved in cell wall biosynthesis